MNLRIFGRPVAIRASRMAINVASVPDAVNRTISADGTSFCTNRPHSISNSWQAPGRVARVIVDMAREEGRRLKDGRIAFRRATHQEIANRIGTTRETVTRMLKDLERQGLIHVEGKEMVVQPDFEKVFD